MLSLFGKFHSALLRLGLKACERDWTEKGFLPMWGGIVETLERICYYADPWLEKDVGSKNQITVIITSAGSAVIDQLFRVRDEFSCTRYARPIGVLSAIVLYQSRSSIFIFANSAHIASQTCTNPPLSLIDSSLPPSLPQMWKNWDIDPSLNFKNRLINFERILYVIIDA